MKKSAVIMLLSTFTATSSMAQSRVGTFSIIPKVGVNIASLSNNDMYIGMGYEKFDNKPNTGINIGVDLQYQASDRVAVSVGAAYSRQGYRYGDTKYKDATASTDEYDVYNTWADYHHNFDYLVVPVMAKCYLFPNFAIGAGVQTGFILDNKSSYEQSSYKQYPNGLREYSNKTETIEGEYTSKTMNAVDVSIPITASYEYMNVVVAATYNFGLTSVTKSPLSKSRNRVISFSVGYKFDL